ncbi:MAG: glycyl radical protein [Chitinophagales bacterium]
MNCHAFSARTDPNTRVGRLRDCIVEAPMEVCVERARYLTESMKSNWESSPLTRISMALEHILNNISVIIRDDELIVGCRTSKLKGAPLFPENKVRWIKGDLEGFEKRVFQRVLITEAEKQELERDIIPFWKGRTVEEYFESLLPPDVFVDMNKYVFAILLEITNGMGHFTMDYSTILNQGFKGIISEAESQYQLLAPSEKESAPGLFYQAVIRSLQAAVRFANRYADRADLMSEQETNPRRAAELKEIARVCRRVPEFAPESFHEAVQSLYFIHLIAQIESGGNSISIGRIDQILFPYYQQDLAAGRITPNQARELLALLFIKVNEIWNVLEEAFIPAGEGPEGKTTQNVTVGGIDAAGEDATNELSYIGLDAYNDIRTVQPNFGIRVSVKSPVEFQRKAVQYAIEGLPIHFFNDDAIVESLLGAGHSIEDARNYGVVGCVEPSAQGKTFGSTFAVQINGAKCVEYALSNGIDNIFGYLSGIKTGEADALDSFDKVWQAYDSQLRHFTRQMARGMECMDRAVAEKLPSPFASAMIQGPLQKGVDLTGGGAVYNSTGVQLIGFSNMVDSLHAVKKAVFADRKFSMPDLAAWLSDNWMDAEEPRSYLYKRVDKFGNDEDEVDALAQTIIDHFCDILGEYTTFRGGHFWPGVFSVGFHVTLGAFTSATADGRYSGDILGNGLTPSNGAALKGPTAIMNSVTKLPLSRLHNGANLNMRFSGPRTDPLKLEALIKGYFQQGGLQVQFNMIDSKTLRAAQDNPDQYRDLVVRVSGYSAYFVNLTDTAQEEIINRMEFEI